MIPTSIGFRILEHTLSGTFSHRQFIETHGKVKGPYIVSEPRRPFKRGDRATVMGYWEPRGLTFADTTYYGGRIEQLTDKRRAYAQWVSGDGEEESERFVPLILRLPHGRFQVATSPGVGWYVVFDPEIYTDEEEAKYAAWDLADRTAEKDLEGKLEDLRAQEEQEEENSDSESEEETDSEEMAESECECGRESRFCSFEDTGIHGDVH